MTLPTNRPTGAYHADTWCVYASSVQEALAAFKDKFSWWTGKVRHEVRPHDNGMVTVWYHLDDKLQAQRAKELHDPTS